MTNANEPTLAEILTERGSKYGPFAGHAEITQALKGVVADALTRRGKSLAPDQQEALDMVAHKIGRIVNGDPDYDDSWADIAGYAQLVVDRLRQEARRRERAAVVDHPTPVLVSTQKPTSGFRKPVRQKAL